MIVLYFAYVRGSPLGSKTLFNLKSDKEDSLPVYAAPVNPTIPVLRKDIRKSILDADSRSTICFPDDDDVELSPHRISTGIQRIGERMFCRASISGWTWSRSTFQWVWCVSRLSLGTEFLEGSRSIIRVLSNKGFYCLPCFNRFSKILLQLFQLRFLFLNTSWMI